MMHIPKIFQSPKLVKKCNEGLHSACTQGQRYSGPRRTAHAPLQPAAQLHGGSWVVAQQHFFCCCINYQNFVSKFAKFDRIFSRFCKFLKILRIFKDYLWFPAIPTKFRENLDEKSPIWDDFSNILKKSEKITEILQIFAKNLQFLN